MAATYELHTLSTVEDTVRFLELNPVCVLVDAGELTVQMHITLPAGTYQQAVGVDGDDIVYGPVKKPDWTMGHVVAHVADNLSVDNFAAAGLVRASEGPTWHLPSDPRRYEPFAKPKFIWDDDLPAPVAA